jgi:transketolase
MNGLGQIGPMPYKHDTSVFAQRFRSFGWETIEIDGNDMKAVLDAFGQARTGGPTSIIARTEKGKGVSFLEGKEGWHGKALNAKEMEKALEELGKADVKIQVEPRRIGNFKSTHTNFPSRISVNYKQGEPVATRTAYGEALKKLGDYIPEIVALDGDVKNSPIQSILRRNFPAFRGSHCRAEHSRTALETGVSRRYTSRRLHVFSRAYG